MNPVDPNDDTAAVPTPPAPTGSQPLTPPAAAGWSAAAGTNPAPTAQPAAAEQPAPPAAAGWSAATGTNPAPTVPPAAAEPLTPPVYESTVAWAPAEPVVKDATPRPRRSRLRWAVALAVVALVVGASAAVAALLVGRSPDATILAYVPDKTIVYSELRLDLPGDQRQAVGAFLSKFPGFADQAALEGKLDEVLDQLVDQATNGEQSYTADIKPWFSGELGFALGPLPEASTIVADPTAYGSARALFLLSIKDPVGAQAWFDAAFKKAGATTTTEAYNGASVTLFGSGDGVNAAFAILDGKVAVVGDETSVKAAIDTGGNSGFSTEPGPKAALDAADSDHVGFVYVALRPLLDWSTSLNKAMSDQLGSAATTALSQSMLDMIPDWGAYWLRVESDALVMETVAPQTAASTGSTSDGASTIVDHVPATAVVVAIANDYGTSLKKSLDVYSSDPSLKQISDALGQALGLLGGTDAALGWIGDTAVVVNVADGTPEGGLIVQPTNAADAQRFFTSIKNLISLGGQQIGASVREETYNGTTITIVDLGSLGSLAGQAGLPAGVTLPAGNVEIAYATTDDLVVIGSGPGFVKSVLDTTKATSLGGNDRYQSLVKRAGSGSTSAFVDIAAIRVLLEGAMASAEPAAVAEYDQNVKPYLTPFDAMIASGSVQGDLTQSTVIVTVK
jgi:hypothetical protein